MTTEFSPRENAFLKLIDIQAKEITQLGMEVDTLRYNKRYTNTKFVKAELAHKISKRQELIESLTKDKKK